MKENTKIVGLIPAHLGSIRFKRKVLHNILGIPMIEHVRRRALNSKIIEKIIVVSGEDEVLNIVSDFGGDTIKTFKNHQNGTSRIAEAIEHINCSHVVIIQGDEPLIQKQHLANLTKSIKKNPLFDTWNSTSNLICEEEINNPNIVKAALNEDGKIIYLFRKSPSIAKAKDQFTYIKKIQGLIAFRKDVLLDLSRKPMSYGEKFESIEQLKIINYNFNIYSVNQPNQVPSINTKNDLNDFYQYLENNEEQLKITKEIIRKNWT